MSSTSQRVLLVEDSTPDARRIAAELRNLGLLVTVISGIHEKLDDGRLAPCSEYGVAAMWSSFFSHEPLKLSDFALILLDGAPDGAFTGCQLLQDLIAPTAGEASPAVIGISNSAGNNKQMCEAGATCGHDKAHLSQIVESVTRLLNLCSVE